MVDAVTGAFSHSGRYLSRLLLSKGRQVINLTNRVGGHTVGLGGTVESRVLNFSNVAALEADLQGVDRLFCTYWARSERQNGMTHEDAYSNAKMLFNAARAAGVQKVIFSSHTRATPDSNHPYLHYKALAVEALREAGLASYGVIRPCGLFGDTPGESTLLNNAAWILRQAPIFLIPGNGQSRFQPIHVRDMAQLQVDVADAAEDVEIDAVGPEALTTEELFSAIHDAVGSKATLVTHVPLSMVWTLTQPFSWYVGDVILDYQDLNLILDDASYSEDSTSATGGRKLTNWLKEVGPLLGKEHISPAQRYHKFVQATQTFQADGQ